MQELNDRVPALLYISLYQNYSYLGLFNIPPNAAGNNITAG